jgi:hypothetical protein
MGLAQVQMALARLYTDAAWRADFLADPEEAAAGLGLGAADVRQLAQLAPGQVQLVAGSLRRKRLNEVAKLLPLSHRALGPRFAALFWRHADTYLPRGTKRHRDDALAFAAFAARTARAEGLEPPWAADLMRYEAGWLAASVPGCRGLLRWFRYDPQALTRALVRDAMPLPEARSTLALWVRLPRGGVWHRTVSWIGRQLNTHWRAARG